jgi:hypothetical protein
MTKYRDRLFMAAVRWRDGDLTDRELLEAFDDVINLLEPLRVKVLELEMRLRTVQDPSEPRKET